MPDPTTPNLVLAQPIRGTDTGVWDIPVNGNTGIIDQAFGSVTTLALTSSPISLTSSQAQNSIIRLTGTLTANIFISLPSIYKFWTIDNQIVNSPSSFCAILLSTTSSGQGIGLPPGAQDIFYDGASVNFRNLGSIGQYWDYGGPQVPSWVNACTKPPYLNCDGTTFSSATYPILANLLGTNTLPDSRGSARYVLNQGTARLSSAVGGVNGDVFLANKATQSTTLVTANLPAYTPSGTNAANTVSITAAQGFTTSGSFQALVPPGEANIGPSSFAVPAQVFTGAAQGGTSTPFGSIGTAYIGGITMIRAA